MCLKPITIRNPTRRYSLYGGQPLQLNVSCGHCAECKQTMRLQWRFRTLNQVNDFIARGGYVYFDTLTYRPKDVPRVSRFIDIEKYGIDDFMCFDSRDWRLFLKNLRRQLSYHHNCVSFKYFLTSEYGTTEGRTHRPHYHVLFFINNKTLDPIEFSKLVSKCWNLGRTDGLPFKPRRYVMDHSYGFYPPKKDDKKRAVSPLKVCNYVAKYITKDSTFQSTINNRLSILQQRLPIEDYTKLIRDVSMFHRQSQGFGKSYVDNIDFEEYNYIMNTGCCRMRDSDIITEVPLPLYYKRHLFMNCLKRDDGSIFWQYNQRGLDYYNKSLFRNIDNVAKRYCAIYLNADSTDQSVLLSLLNGRTFNDLAAYEILYRGRSRAFGSVNQLSDVEFNHYDWINTINSSLFVNTANDFECIDVDDDYRLVSVGGINYDYDWYMRHNMINQYSDDSFANFDRLISLLNSLSSTNNKNKQSLFDFIEDINKRFKSYENYEN